MDFEEVYQKLQKKYWKGAKPANCDLCHTPLMNSFVDGATDQGPWAIMCGRCHRDHGRGLGTGRGQRYDLKTLEKLEG